MCTPIVSVGAVTACILWLVFMSNLNFTLSIFSKIKKKTTLDWERERRDYLWLLSLLCSDLGCPCQYVPSLLIR